MYIWSQYNILYQLYFNKKGKIFLKEKWKHYLQLEWCHHVELEETTIYFWLLLLENMRGDKLMSNSTQEVKKRGIERAQKIEERMNLKPEITENRNKQ